MRVDAAQTAHAQSRAEIVQQGRVGNRLTVGQTGKAAPATVLGQQLGQEVEGVGRSQQNQKQQPIQLRRTIGATTTWATLRTDQLVDEVVGDEGRKFLQQGSRAGLSQGRVHACGGTLSAQPRRHFCLFTKFYEELLLPA